jgi:hypothetical protein
MVWLLLACGPSPTVAPFVVPAAEPAAPAPAPPPAPPPPRTVPAGAFTLEVEPGLTLAAYDPPEIADGGYSKPDVTTLGDTDRRLFVVTVDPAAFEVVYLSARDPAVGAGPAVGAAWARTNDLAVAWNPGMFEPDGRATGYTRAGAFVGQEQVRRNRQYSAWFVGEPVRDGLPAAATLAQAPPQGSGSYAPVGDLPAAFADQLAGYGFVSQSLAIVEDGKVVYPARKNQWSELAFGTDDHARIVVVFSRWPYEMRELGARVQALGLGVVSLMHGEGGPEATLVVRIDGVDWVQCGSYETGFWDGSNLQAWPIPAVMGVRARPAR